MAFKDIFKRLSKRDTGEEQREESAPADILTALMRGDKITRQQVLTIPAVSSNIDFICSSVASMPIRLYKRVGNKVRAVENDNRTKLLNVDTGDTLDAFQMKKALIEDYFLSSGGYCFIERYRNEVTGLYYVENDYVSVNFNYQPIYKSYVIYVEGGTYKPYDFIKLLRNTKTGAFGTSIIDELNDALETAYQTQVYQLGLVKSGGNKKGFLKSEHKLGKEEIQALKNAWRNLYANNGESVVVLNNGLDFKESANTSVEMQLNESIKTLGEQIDKIFHISDDFENTFKFAIYPVIKAFETALNRDLLLEREKDKYFFAFDDKELLKATIKERYEVYKLAKECQLNTINERRRMENLNEIDGGDVIDFGLGAVLYDVKTKTFFTPNTNSVTDVKKVEEESIIDSENDTERATPTSEGEQVTIDDVINEEAEK